MDTIPRKSVEMYSKLIGKLSLPQAKTVILRALSALAGIILAKMYMKPTALTLEQRKDNLKKIISEQWTKIVSQAKKMEYPDPDYITPTSHMFTSKLVEMDHYKEKKRSRDQEIQNLEKRFLNVVDNHSAECKLIKDRIAELQVSLDASKKRADEEIDSLEKEIAHLEGR